MPASNIALDTKRLLEALHGAGVAFVVIGGVAAVAHGSAHVTGDLDICYDRSRENLARLVEALAPLKPRLRGVTEQVPFLWDARTLQHGLNFTLLTEAGALDLLGEVPGLEYYEKVRATSVLLHFFGMPTFILSLEGLICAKEAAGRSKDLRMLPELRALQAMQRAQEKGGQPPTSQG